jgi:hypothetical protein
MLLDGPERGEAEAFEDLALGGRDTLLGLDRSECNPEFPFVVWSEFISYLMKFG